MKFLRKKLDQLECLFEKGGKFDPEFRYDRRPFLYGDPVN